jgi:LAO/AO transport system kinase
LNYDPESLVDGVLSGRRASLARALTLVESQRSEHRLLAQQLLAGLPASKGTQRIGITGPPGSGKSSLIESLGLMYVQQGFKVGVLAIDPSSQITGGSILGDKTRMEELSQSEMAFIRPSPAGDHLGGVARRTRESIQVLEAAGYQRVLVETVGVGQSETSVAHLVDCVLMLALPAGGDEIQGIKRGLMEIADVVFVNKAEEPLAAVARQTANFVSSALRLFSSAQVSATHQQWNPKVLLGSALTGLGLAALLEQIQSCCELRQETQHRAQQSRSWFREELEQQVLASYFGQPGISFFLDSVVDQISSGLVSPNAAVSGFLAQWPVQSVKTVPPLPPNER